MFSPVCVHSYENVTNVPSFVTMLWDCAQTTHVKTRKLLQICKQVVNKVIVKPILGCVRTACPQLL
jgi:hypothetical protein